ncbi:MAG: hypothetical protein LBH43_12865, partial [Treponema sp.]|nr:hypothetical protein [Treponema sp.]
TKLTPRTKTKNHGREIMIINRMAVGLAMSIVLSMADVLATGKVIKLWGLGTLKPRPEQYTTRARWRRWTFWRGT